MRLIDGDDFQKRIEQLCDALCEYSKKQRQYMCSACKLGNVLDVIDDAPTVDAVPVRHGQWIINIYKQTVCSECKSPALEVMTGCIVARHLEVCRTPYCPNCGARMDGKENSNETD